MTRNRVSLFCAALSLCALLCSCNVIDQPAGASATPAVDINHLATTAPASATPDPVASAEPLPSPTPALIECNIYVQGQVLAHRAYVDPNAGAQMMAPLEDFTTALAVNMENDAASVTLYQPDTGTTVVIEDIYAQPPLCTVNGAQSAMTAAFVSRNNVVYGPLDMLTSWFGFEWVQNEAGDILVAPLAGPTTAIDPEQTP